MAELGVKEQAAISRIAARLAPLVTNGIIEGVAHQYRVGRVVGNNKVDKLSYVLAFLLSDGRATRVSSDAIVALTMEAHHRTVTSSGAIAMTWDDPDAIVAEMKVLGLDAGDLANTGWRKGLKRKTEEAPPKPEAKRGVVPGASVPSVRPREYARALDHVRTLLADGTNPQWRGRQLEMLVLEVLATEVLSPEHNLVNTGEQIDHAFVLDGQHYLIECRWHDAPVGAPQVREFSAKVGRKAEGTFGVLLSMSGFVGNINETASLGARLNCVGIIHQQFMEVLEGRRTFGDLVRNARALASRRSLFHV